MREAGVWVRDRRRYRATTNSNHRQPVFENRLKRDFAVAVPNQVYAGDITYVWTQEGWSNTSRCSTTAGACIRIWTTKVPMSSREMAIWPMLLNWVSDFA